MSTYKQALREAADRDWFEEWFKKEYHPNKTGPYIKDQMFFAIQAARAPLLDELEAAKARIAELEAREVKLPQRMGPEGYHIDEAYLVAAEDGDYFDRDEVIEALTVAGIGIKGGE